MGIEVIMSFSTGTCIYSPHAFLSYAAVGHGSDRLMHMMMEEGNTAPDIINFHRRFAALPIAS